MGGNRERARIREKQKLKARRIRSVVLMVGIGVVSLPLLIWGSPPRTCGRFKGCCFKSRSNLRASRERSNNLHGLPAEKRPCDTQAVVTQTGFK